MIQQRKLLDHAKRMRHEATPYEVILWRHLSHSRVGGFKFRRQHVIGRFIADFFCPTKGLIIELDGDTHDALTDLERDEILKAQGCTTLRFTNAQIANELDGVLETILGTLQSTPDRWGVPHPNPSPEGEGL